jgi:hypothetical protein
MNYKIIDNFLSEESYNKIVDTLTNNYFPWFLQNKINDYQVESNNNYYFSHTFFDNNKQNSDAFYLWEELLNKINFTKLIRVKANLYPKTNTILEHAKHLDYTENGITSLYYINTNNGFTNLNDEIKVNSVNNRFLKFNNNILHNSSTCTDEKFRLTVVCNYIE